jgi:ABC-type glycerol-3-phosphate transport system substrate-binding protein
MFANLSSYIKADSQEIQLDDIFAAALVPGQLNGIQYSLPDALGVQGLYLNTDLFQKSGLNLPAKNWSWEDFAATAKRLTVSDSTGKKVQWGWQNNAVASDFAQWMSIVYAYGGQVLSPGFTAPAFSTPQTVTGLKLLQKMTYQDAVIGGGFPAGTAAMMIRPAETVSSWLAKASFQWQGFPLPQGPARTALMGGAHQIAINAASRNKEAAWEFVKYYVSKSGQEVAAKFPTVPFRRSMFSTAVKYNPGVAVLLQQMDNWTQYTNRLHNQINTIWVPVMKDLYAGSVSPEQAASAINDQIAAIGVSVVRSIPTCVGRNAIFYVASERSHRYNPTRVGNTRLSKRPPAQIPVYPHLCGENEGCWSTARGLSRYTPTEVGKTTSSHT